MLIERLGQLLAHRYLLLPGSTGNYASTPDHAALDVLGDLDLRVALALPDWTPGATTYLIVKSDFSAQKAYAFYINSSNFPFLVTTSNGSANRNNTADATIATPNGESLGLRVTLDINDGGGNRIVKFWTKAVTPHGAHADILLHAGWTQLGSTITTAVVTTIFNSTAPLEIGGSVAGVGYTAGKVYAAAIFSGIDGTKVFDVDFTRANVSAASVADGTNGLPVTINQSGATPAAIVRKAA